jgi:hypothetical protein
MITDNEVYTYVANFIRERHGEIYVTGSRVYKVAEFPCASIVCIDGTPFSETIDCTETNRRSTFEVNVYSNKTMSDAKQIAEDIKLAFKECGYRCRVHSPLDNVNDLTIKRYVGSYTRVIGDGDSLNKE